MIPHWLTVLSVVMLAAGAVGALLIVFDIFSGHRQRMWIMSIVWPVSALYGTVFVLWAYFKYGRQSQAAGKTTHDASTPKPQTPFAIAVAKATLHCGSGCTIGDFCAEFLALSFPVVTIWLGWKSLFPDSEGGKIFAVWILDFILAFLIGIAFQFFTIKPMRNLSTLAGLTEAVKADSFSLGAWQIGMYGFMAVAQFAVFKRIWHHLLSPNMPEFWFMMQIAMLFGFATAYPVNWWLVKSGIKEKM